MFVPGQLVVCIDVSPGLFLGPPPLTKGSIYTVDSVVSDTGITVEGVDPWPAIGFRASRFRPLSPRSISIVESLKAPVPGKVTEPA